MMDNILEPIVSEILSRINKTSDRNNDILSYKRLYYLYNAQRHPLKSWMWNGSYK